MIAFPEAGTANSNSHSLGGGFVDISLLAGVPESELCDGSAAQVCAGDWDVLSNSFDYRIAFQDYSNLELTTLYNMLLLGRATPQGEDAGFVVIDEFDSIDIGNLNDILQTLPFGMEIQIAASSTPDGDQDIYMAELDELGIPTGFILAAGGEAQVALLQATMSPQGYTVLATGRGFATSVPEPTTISLLILMTSLLANRRVKGFGRHA